MATVRIRVAALLHSYTGGNKLIEVEAADVREVGKRALLEAGGRKEISMMVPVVFMLLPVTVLFALFPALSTLVSLTR